MAVLKAWFTSGLNSEAERSSAVLMSDCSLANSTGFSATANPLANSLKSFKSERLSSLVGNKLNRA